MLYIVVNPASKSGIGKKRFELLKAELNKNHIVYQPFFTDKKYGAKRCVENIVQKIGEHNIQNPVIAILGGDGTVNEVMSALPLNSNISIAYLPTGSSNDLARSLEISSSPADFVKTYKEKKYKNTDFGQFTDISSGKKTGFCVSCGIGLDAAVCKETNASPVKDILNRMHLGKLSYVAVALKQICTAKQTSCDIILSNGNAYHFEKVLFIVTMIQPYEGGGIMMAPMADCHDGEFDIMVVSDLHRLQALYLLPLAFSGKHTKAKPITFLKAQSLTIKTADPMTVHTDGEYVGELNEILLQCVKDGVIYL